MKAFNILVGFPLLISTLTRATPILPPNSNSTLLSNGIPSVDLPEDLVSRSEPHRPSLFHSDNTAHFEDVGQGPTDNCWLIAAFKVLAFLDPHLFPTMIRSTEAGAIVTLKKDPRSHTSGESSTNVNYNAARKLKNLPLQLTGRPWWPRALAQALNSKYGMECRRGGKISRGLEVLLGNPVDYITVKTSKKYKGQAMEDLHRCFVDAVAPDFVGTVGTKNGRTGFPKDHFLVGGHTYGITGYNVQARKVTLLNPWPTSAKREGHEKEYTLAQVAGLIDECSSASLV